MKERALKIAEPWTPAPVTHSCYSCGVRLASPGCCAECYRRTADAEARQAFDRWLRTLPARQRDVTWANLADLRRDDGDPRVALRGGVQGATKLRATLEGVQRAVLCGPAGSGKTTVAAAFLRAAKERAPAARVRFVSAPDLPGNSASGVPVVALALSADVLVLDDLGAELENAPAASGLCAQRIGPASRVICERFERGRRLLVTTGLERSAVIALYGDRVARRLYEAAPVVRLRGEAT